VSNKKLPKVLIMNFSYNILRRESNVSAPIERWVDETLIQNELIVFQQGSFVETLGIKYNDYIALLIPKKGILACA
jgi:hypothetical protein